MVLPTEAPKLKPSQNHWKIDLDCWGAGAVMTMIGGSFVVTPWPSPSVERSGFKASTMALATLFASSVLMGAISSDWW